MVCGGGHKSGRCDELVSPLKEGFAGRVEGVDDDGDDSNLGTFAFSSTDEKDDANFSMNNTHFEVHTLAYIYLRNMNNYDKVLNRERIRCLHREVSLV